MEAALKGPDGVGRCVDCATIDSFAWHLVRRWRSLAHELGVPTPEGDFQAITAAAGRLLRHPGVGPWVARKYPLLVVDEMQDCKGGEIELLSGLAPHLCTMCAADAFQDLSGDSENEAISWAKDAGEVVTLDYNWRTRVEGLLAAARNLREGLPLKSDRGTGFEIASAPTAASGGGNVAWRIRVWSQSDEIAIISPTAPGTSPFVDDLLTWISTRKARSKRTRATAGPFPVKWEASEEELRLRLLAALELPDDPECEVCCGKLAESAHRTKAHDFRDWVQKQQNVGGRRTVTVGEATDEIGRIVHRRRAFGPREARRTFALTAHQAKNCEFESVVVLWPLKVQPGAERQRRLLYNAITRARERAIVVVQDPQGKRLQAPLFAGG